jgi:hypothetical protein
LLASCAAPHPDAWSPATPASWSASQARLAALRETPREPWAGEVLVRWREPRTGQTVVGQGGIGVAPGRAVRMILAGGPGATMLDAWITPEQWRVAVPPLGIVRRGGRDEPPDVPVAFLRWWFFHPLEGRLVAATARPPAGWLLRDDDAVIEVREQACGRGVGLEVTRRERDAGHVDSLAVCRHAGPPSPGDHVTYEDRTTGLGIALTLETLAAGPPMAEAFADPDAAGGAP